VSCHQAAGLLQAAGVEQQRTPIGMGEGAAGGQQDGLGVAMSQSLGALRPKRDM